MKIVGLTLALAARCGSNSIYYRATAKASNSSAAMPGQGAQWADITHATSRNLNRSDGVLDLLLHNSNF